MNTRRKGFTLIEILIAIGVVIVLASILVPVVGGAKRYARVTGTKAIMKNMTMALDNYDNDYASFPTWMVWDTSQFKNVLKYDGTYVLWTALNNTGYLTIPQKNVIQAGLDTRIYDAFGSMFYYDELASLVSTAPYVNGYAPWGGDNRTPGPLWTTTKDPRGGTRKNKTYDIWSLGPDGQPGGNDDITNWN